MTHLRTPLRTFGRDPFATEYCSDSSVSNAFSWG